MDQAFLIKAQESFVQQSKVVIIRGRETDPGAKPKARGTRSDLPRDLPFIDLTSAFAPKVRAQAEPHRPRGAAVSGSCGLFVQDPSGRAADGELRAGRSVPLPLHDGRRRRRSPSGSARPDAGPDRRHRVRDQSHPAADLLPPSQRRTPPPGARGRRRGTFGVSRGRSQGESSRSAEGEPRTFGVLVDRRGASSDAAREDERAAQRKGRSTPSAGG